MSEFRVTGVFLIAGNPTKAWAGTTGENDLVNVPDDVWQEQVHPFDNLDSAKGFIRSCHPQITTHLVLEYREDDGADWTTLVAMDSDKDHLDDAAPGVLRPSMVTSLLPGEHAVQDLPAPFPAQKEEG